jgi:UDP-glucose:glycoprotein glucosyltransferase
MQMGTSRQNSSLKAGVDSDNCSSEVLEEVVFKHIPQSTLLTLALETQHAWQAFPKESVHDLDNIRLSDLKPSGRETGVEATFELSNIIVEGHAREKVTNTPPRGLQLELSDGFHATNTLVMANLGYHQLQANPGLWTFSIREGRSSEVFTLDSMEGVSSAGPSVDGKAWQVLVTSFEGVTVFPKFTRKAGMEGVDLLDENAAAQSVDVKAKAAEAFSELKNR